MLPPDSGRTPPPRLADPSLTVTGPAPFRWQDGERVIVFGSGRLAQAGELLGEGYALLTTERASACAPAVLEAAASVHHVDAGRVDELAASLRERVHGELLVALGGGRVIDTAKALAAADPPRRVAAIPTTLSGAEMTPIHRHAAGVAGDTARVRPAIVLNDPDLSASQPLQQLAASAANALGHAAEGPLTPMRNPPATAMAHQGARLLVDGLSRGEPDRERLALGSLLCGFVIGSTGYGLQHVLAQTLVRFADLSHGAANAVMLPHSLQVLHEHFPDELDALGRALGADPVDVAQWLAELTATTTLSGAGVSEAQLDRCAEEAAGRPELHLTPPPLERDQLRALYERAR